MGVASISCSFTHASPFNCCNQVFHCNNIDVRYSLHQSCQSSTFIHIDVHLLFSPLLSSDHVGCFKRSHEEGFLQPTFYFPRTLLIFLFHFQIQHQGISLIRINLTIYVTFYSFASSSIILSAMILRHHSNEIPCVNYI